MLIAALYSKNIIGQKTDLKYETNIYIYHKIYIFFLILFKFFYVSFTYFSADMMFHGFLVVILGQHFKYQILIRKIFSLHFLTSIVAQRNSIAVWRLSRLPKLRYDLYFYTHHLKNENKGNIKDVHEKSYLALIKVNKIKFSHPFLKRTDHLYKNLIKLYDVSRIPNLYVFLVKAYCQFLFDNIIRYV